MPVGSAKTVHDLWSVATMSGTREGAHCMPRWQAQPATIFHASHEFS